MYLAYLDDSGTDDKAKPFQVMTAVVIPDRSLRNTEIFGSLAIESSIPKDKAPQFWKKFEEFKAFELFNGHGPFEGIEQSDRFAIIDFLLDIICNYKIAIVYGAVEKSKLRNQVYGSANPVDMCFRICMNGIEKLMLDIGSMQSGELSLLIADNSDKYWKVIRDSFYDYRQRLRPVSGTRLSPLHDDMYFGDSKYSIGLQLADVCGYFISKHLEQYASSPAQSFYNKIKDQIVYSQVQPQPVVPDPEIR